MGSCQRKYLPSQIWGWSDAKKSTIANFLEFTGPLKVKARPNRGPNGGIEFKTPTSKAPQIITIKGKNSDITGKYSFLGKCGLCLDNRKCKCHIKGYLADTTFGSLLATANSTNPNYGLFFGG